MRGYLEDLKAGGRPMTDKELAEHYKHLYSEVKKQKDVVVEYVNSEKFGENFPYVADECQVKSAILRMLGEIE